jgi:hypothetical protein
MYKLKQAFIIIISLCILRISATAQDTTTSTIKPARLGLILGATSLTLAGAYVYVNSAWWANQGTSFHFDNGMDYKYAKNVDKAGHFMGGQVCAELFQESLKWAGVKEERSYLYAFLLGTTVQVFVEMKDGYAPTYGFSVGDIAAGSVGSLMPYLKYKIPVLAPLSFKVSYYKHDDYYYKLFPHADGIDDYMNQTYWVSASVNDWLPKGSNAEKWWPDFLCIAGGWGVDNTLDKYYTGVNLDKNKGYGNYEYYLSVDIDWKKIIPQRTGGQRILAKTLNYVKLPLPTLQLGPNVKYYWAFW